jgi:hypothetical protein
LLRIAGGTGGQILALLRFQHKGVTMSRRKEHALDVAEYTVGGPLFFIVSAVTAAVMAIGFAVMTAIDRALH